MSKEEMGLWGRGGEVFQLPTKRTVRIMRCAFGPTLSALPAATFTGCDELANYSSMNSVACHQSRAGISSVFRLATRLAGRMKN